MNAREKKLHKWAMEQFQACVDREAELRPKQTDDRRFACLDQWPAEIRKQRENDPNGPRPCLTIDKITQYRQQIVNEIRKNRPAVKVRPVDSKADPATAKILQEKIRHIEERSKADIAYETASEWAIDVGEGYFRVVTEYIDGENQEICIKPIANRFSVYMGPHLMPDGSDAQLCFITEDMPVSAFRKAHPEAKYKAADLEAEGDLQEYWDADEKVRVAELMYIESSTTNMLELADGNEVSEAEYWESDDKEEERARIVDSYPKESDTVKWLKMTSAEILEEQEFSSKFLPVVKVVGHERIVDGKIDRWGIVRPAKDSQRLYNYWASVLTENLGLTARSKWLAAAGQVEGFEAQWRKSNTSTDPFLTYNPIDVNGQPVPPPVKVPAGSPDVAILQQLKLIEHDIQTSLGMFRASVGDSQGDQSGRAIRALQGQSDTATFHFPDNLARSIRHLGRILIDMIPRVYDVRQIFRLIGEDGKPGEAIIDPRQPEAMRQVETSSGIRTIYNPGVGTYDVVATVGPSYATKRQESSEFMLEISKSQPELLKFIGHILFKELDINGADRIAEIFEKMLPPQLQEPKEGQPPVPPQVAAQMAQMQQIMQAMQQELQEAKAGTQEAQMKIQAQSAAEQQRIALNAENAKAQLEIQAFTQQEQARLAREKAEADLQLKAWIAEQELQLDRAKAQAEEQRTGMKFEIDRAVKVKQIQDDDKAQVAQVAPQIMSALDEMLKRMEGGKLQGLKPIKDAAGNVIGGVATYANGETRQIALQ